MKQLRILIKIIIITGLVILKTVLTFIAMIGLFWVIFILGPYDGAKSKTVAPASTGDFNIVDDTIYKSSAGAEYFYKVKEYADFMITHGRDRYGTEHSPLFATTLNRETGNVFRKNPPDAPKGIRDSDRTYRGANPSKDNSLYSILYSLTEITGNPRYAQEADKAIKWFFNHCQSPETGLMAWGEHIGWDFFKEAPIKWNTQSWLHELKGFSHWDRVWELAPDASEKFALGLWDHQIYAHTGEDAGEFSRHANYYRHKPSKGRAFPGHAANYIEVWTKAYKETGKEIFLTAIETVLKYYEKNTSPASGAILYASDFPEQYSLGHSMGLAKALYNVKDQLPQELGTRMKKLADSTDTLYLSFDHDPSKGGKGFLKSAHLHTLVPGEYRSEHKGANPYTKMWSAGYGASGNSNQANSCYSRYRQTGIEGYKKLFMKTVEAYYVEDPPKTKVLYPGNYSSLFNMMKHAYELTGEERFLTKAKMYMDLSMETFLDDQSPLPKASNHSDHYEAITGGPGLMHNLLRLWEDMNKTVLN